MEYITLKNSVLNVSRICMGGCPMGGYGWGNVQEQELIDAVHTAIEYGVNFFDTADTYGLGQSEITLGKALEKKRNKVVIATKFGVRAEKGKTTFYDNSPEYIRKALEASLRRIGTDYIDLYQVHYRDGKTLLSEVVGTLEDLREKGYIRYYGLSNIHKSDIDEIRAFSNMFVSFQDEYSLACRKNEHDIISIANELSMTPLTWGSLGQGILTGKYDRNVKFDSDDRRSKEIYVNFHGEKLLKNLRIVDEIKKISSVTGKTVPSIAIRFILDYIKDSVGLTGVKKPQQIISNIEAMDWNLSLEHITALENISR